MSEQSMEVVRRFVGVWSGRDFVAMAQDDPASIEEMMGYLTDDVEVRFSGLMDQQTNSGADATIAALMEWLEPWSEYYQEAEEFIDVDSAGSVVVTFRQWGNGKASGIRTEMTVAHLYVVRGDKISHLHEYLSKAEALAAAGLPG